MRKLFARARWFRAGMIVLALSIGFVGIAAASESVLDLKCRSLLQRLVFNCGCTTEFLDRYFSAEQADILLSLWVFAVNDSESGRELRALYIRYGREAIDDTVMRLHTYRDRLWAYCAQGGSPGTME